MIFDDFFSRIGNKSPKKHRVHEVGQFAQEFIVEFETHLVGVN